MERAWCLFQLAMTRRTMIGEVPENLARIIGDRAPITVVRNERSAAELRGLNRPYVDLRRYILSLPPVCVE